MIPTVGDWPPRPVIGAPSADPPLTSEKVTSGFLFFLALGVGIGIWFLCPIAAIMALPGLR
jgi:hypothetical protein